MRAAVAIALAVLLAACATPPAPKPDRDMKPDGEAWFCSTEVSGMLSVCERTRKKCKKAKKYLYGLSHRRGDQMTLGTCKKQKRAYCLTAERRIPREPAEDDEDEAFEDDEDSDAEDEESSEEAFDAESAEGDDEARVVVEDTIWLCYATVDNCEWQRKNMYYFGFTHVSRCGKWK